MRHNDSVNANNTHGGYVIGVDFGTLSGRALVVRVADGAELGTAVHLGDDTEGLLAKLHDLDERLSGVGVGVELTELGRGHVTRRTDVRGRQDAARHRDEMREEIDGLRSGIRTRGR